MLVSFILSSTRYLLSAVNLLQCVCSFFRTDVWDSAKQCSAILIQSRPWHADFTGLSIATTTANSFLLPALGDAPLLQLHLTSNTWLLKGNINTSCVVNSTTFRFSSQNDFRFLLQTTHWWNQPTKFCIWKSYRVIIIKCPKNIC